MKNELRDALVELNGLIFNGLKQDDPDSKMAAAMSILLQINQMEAMIEKVCCDSN